MKMINEVLRLLRIVNDDKQASLAKGLGIAPSLVSNIERGRSVTLDTLERYAKHYKIPLSSILFFQEVGEAETIKGRIKFAIQSAIIKEMLKAEEA